MGESDLTSDDWESLIVEAMDRRPEPPEIEYVAKKPSQPKTWMDPLRAALQDATTCWIKASRTGPPFSSLVDQLKARSVVNEQIAGRLGELLGAPTPSVLIVRVSPNRVRQELNGRIWAGLHHASKHVESLLDREYKAADTKKWRTTAPDANYPRFAALAVLYGWTSCAGDHQFHFEGTDKKRVWSIDNGMLLGNGKVKVGDDPDSKWWPDWDLNSLSARPPASLDQMIQRNVPFSNNDVRDVVSRLEMISPQQIASVVAAVPDDWYISCRERIGLAQYLHERRQTLVEQYLTKGES
ncbi:MAG: hypothetical protein KF883_10190 [Thermomicrobiales bacterium]|nr:hypothetical protein [Thermomicrobiales bacterium]